MKFLHGDTMINRMLGRFIDIIFLNFFWLICSLPIVTVGASTTALYSVTLEMAAGDEADLFKDFFRAFKKNWKKGTVLYLITLVTGAVLIADFVAAILSNMPGKIVFELVILAVGYLWLAEVCYVFAVLAYFDKPVKETIKFTFIRAMKNGLYTIFVMFLNCMPFLILYKFFTTGTMTAWLIFLVVGGEGAIAWFSSIQMIRCFDPERVKQNRMAQMDDE